MSAEIGYVFVCIWEDSRAVESQTAPLCKNVKPYQENNSHTGPERESGRVLDGLTGPTNVNHHANHPELSAEGGGGLVRKLHCW